MDWWWDFWPLLKNRLHYSEHSFGKYRVKNTIKDNVFLNCIWPVQIDCGIAIADPTCGASAIASIISEKFANGPYWCLGLLKLIKEVYNKQSKAGIILDQQQEIIKENMLSKVRPKFKY